MHCRLTALPLHNRALPFDCTFITFPYTAVWLHLHYISMHCRLTAPPLHLHALPFGCTTTFPYTAIWLHLHYISMHCRSTAPPLHFHALPFDCTSITFPCTVVWLHLHYISIHCLSTIRSNLPIAIHTAFPCYSHIVMLYAVLTCCSRPFEFINTVFKLYKRDRGHLFTSWDYKKPLIPQLYPSQHWP